MALVFARALSLFLSLLLFSPLSLSHVIAEPFLWFRSEHLSSELGSPQGSKLSLAAARRRTCLQPAFGPNQLFRSINEARMPSKGRKCTLINSTVLCTLARDGSGDPIKVTSPCRACGEWRCKTHCRCGRQGTALGRRAPRPGQPQAAAAKAVAAPKALAKAAAKAVAAPRAFLQAASASSTFQVFNESTWLQQCLGEMQDAGSVLIASMVFDEPSLCDALLSRLRAPAAAFTCQVVVDRQNFRQRLSRHQRPRLLELQLAGAQVRLATGHPGRDVFGPHSRCGVMHLKAVVLDSRVAYSVSANLTLASRTNRELVFRLAGPSAGPVLAAVADAFQSGQMLRDSD